MFGKKDDNKPHSRIDSLIGAGTRVEGCIRFTGGLRIDGEVVGGVEAIDGAAASTLVLSEHARVEGPIRVAHLVSNGTVVGNVAISESLEMQLKSRIVGDVEYAMVEMHQGAVIDGHLVHKGSKTVELKSKESN